MRTAEGISKQIAEIVKEADQARPAWNAAPKDKQEFKKYERKALKETRFLTSMRNFLESQAGNEQAIRNQKARLEELLAKLNEGLQKHLDSLDREDDIFIKKKAYRKLHNMPYLEKQLQNLKWLLL